MKEQILKRSVSYVLTLCMLFLMLPVISLDVTAVGDEDVFQLDADCQVLKFVDEEVFNAADHVARLPEEETLSSYAFLNRDGTKTVYFLNENAKYYDSTGAVKEKNIDLVAGLNAYTVTQNDVQLSIPADPASGIDMTYAGYDISLVPQGGSSTMVQHTDNSVGYINYYGKGTALLYTPTYSGIKEDILLAAYTGISSFTFLLNTDGLRLFSQNGRYFLAASADSDMQIRLGDVVAYDALCNMHRGTLTATSITEGQQYLLTVSVDESFLTDESTVYPVVIDPTLTVSDETHGSNAIEDAPIFSYFPNVNHGSYIYNRVGYVNSNYGVGRTVIRPTGLLNSSVYQNLSIDQIASATFHIRDASGSGSATVDLYALNNPAWSESNVTWNNVGNLWPIAYASASVGGNAMASFDITSLVVAWKQGTENPNSGFILLGANESTSQRALVSSEGAVGAPGYYPYISITYTFGNEAVDIDEGSSRTLDASQITGSITWASSNTSVATVSSSGVVTGVKAGTTTVTASVNGIVEKTFTVYVTIPDGVYYIKNIYSARYLTAADAGISNGTDVQQYFKFSDGDAATTSAEELSQMWKIKYLSSGYYSIRPMHKLNMGLDVTGSNTDIWSIGTSDALSSIPSYAQWTITFNTYGYLFENASAGKAMTTGVNAANGATINVAETPSGTPSTQYRWLPERITSPPSGVLIYDAATGKTVNNSAIRVDYNTSTTQTSANLIGAVYSGDSINQTVTWSSSDESTVIISNGSVLNSAAEPGAADVTCTSYEKPSIFAKCTIRAASNSSLFALAENNVARDTYFTQTNSILSTLSTSQFTQTFNTMSRDDAIEQLQCTSIFYIHTHGSQNTIYLGTTGSGTINLTIDFLENIDLSNLKFALLLTCETGLGGYSYTNVVNNDPVNIVERMVCCGAETVIGFEDITYVDECNDFAPILTEFLVDEGMTVEEAIAELSLVWYGVSDIAKLAVIGGNASLTLN